MSALTAKWRHRPLLALLILSTIVALAPLLVVAQRFTATPLDPDSTTSLAGRKASLPHGPDRQGQVSVIVKLKGDALVNYQGGVRGLAPTSPRATGRRIDVASRDSQVYLSHLAEKHNKFEAATWRAVPRAKVTHRYDVVLNGVAMIVPADELKAVAALPDVEAIYPDALLHVDTDNSPQFIGAPAAWSEFADGKEDAGEGVVVGVLDTGIWPEHPSFLDPDPAGKAYAPLGSWHGTACQFGGAVPGDAPFTCNNKLVGAERVMATYTAFNSLQPGEYTSARDDDGHGTHTSSTAAGNNGVAASIFGVSRGKVSGIAPRARVAMYKVCGAVGCYSSDSAAAIQHAIRDGVNVINFSISGGQNPYADAVSLAFLDAYNAGIFVAASAGNAGPGADTTDHREPWVTTVAASTQNRQFATTATIVGAGGATLSLTGASITRGILAAAPVVLAPDALCAGPYAPGTFTGTVVVCRRGTLGRAEKGYNVLQGGAAGMILYNQSPSVTDLETDNHYLPAVHVQYADGQALLAFLAANPGATATWPNGARTSAEGDVMASFSSRGGPGQTLGISKPDITAPGVQILAGHSPQHMPPPGGVALGPQGELFQAIAGTSMSSPHIAGAGALLKSLHPDWTPGKIRSALMTTARIDVVKEDGVTAATPFDDGSGRVNLRNAWFPKLTYDATGADFIAHRNDLWNVNYPSLYLPVMPGKMTVQRTFHNEAEYELCPGLSVARPADMKVSIVPDAICVPPGGYATFQITIDAHDVPLGEVRHARLNFNLGYFTSHFPITIVRKQPVVTLAKSCDPTTFPVKTNTRCTITAANTTFSDASVNLTDALPGRLGLDPLSVTGATASGNTVTFSGTLAGALPPDVSIGVGTSPADGYLPLSVFGVAPISGVTDDSITNFNVPAFVYAGETYTRLGVGSNGYLVVGGGTGSPDIAFLGQNLPNPARPNNVLAPFWTDLNPPAGGALRIATLTDGVHHWIVVDWAAVKEFSTPRFDTFEAWIGFDGVEDISFAYGPIQGNGDGGFLTVGAENRFGNRGQNYYYNGTGTLPSEGTQLRVTGAPPAPGETRAITFQAKGRTVGTWENCAQMTSDLFQGTNTACVSGTVTP